MIKRCRFCGEKIQSDATDCEHCGKVLVKKTTNDEDQKVGLNDIESWKSQAVPSWVMYAVVVFAVLYVGLMAAKGCSGPGMGDEENPSPISAETATESESSSPEANQ